MIPRRRWPITFSIAPFRCRFCRVPPRTIVPIPFGRVFDPPRRLVPPRISVRTSFGEAPFSVTVPPRISVSAVSGVPIAISASVRLVGPSTLSSIPAVSSKWLHIRILWNPYELPRWMRRRSEKIRAPTRMMDRVRSWSASVATINNNIHRIDGIITLDSRFG